MNFPSYNAGDLTTEVLNLGNNIWAVSILGGDCDSSFDWDLDNDYEIIYITSSLKLNPTTDGMLRLQLYSPGTTLTNITPYLHIQNNPDVANTYWYSEHRNFRGFLLLKGQKLNFHILGAVCTWFFLIKDYVNPNSSDEIVIKKCDLWKFITQGCEF